MADGEYRSAAIPANGETITITNSFTGDLQITKVVSGPPASNIAIYELSIACDKVGPVERFLLKDRQSKLYPDLVTGTTCVVVETRSDGAQVSFTDNSGQPDDATVTIALTPVSCVDQRLSAAPACRVSVIVTNTYVPVAPVPLSAPVASQVAATLSASVVPTASALPMPDAAPATPLVAEPTFTG